jgi:hypothetical protein
VKSLNEVFSSLQTRRRYEVWFVRLGLADGTGAWWFRYLLMNPGRGGCAGNPRGMPVQVWATWFPADGKAQGWIQGFPVNALKLSGRGGSPFHFEVGANRCDENSCRGELAVEGHRVSWDLQFQSTFSVVMSDKGWIGFSRTPHSDAVFSGHITLDGRRFAGSALGLGVQGHNCGYRQRNLWTWAHACFPRDSGTSTFEALIYEMPLGLFFRKAVFWHEGRQFTYRKLVEEQRDCEKLRWQFRCSGASGDKLDVAINGSGLCIHRVPYLKTNCSGDFEVANNSFASAAINFEREGRIEKLETKGEAVLEMVG